jgi:hypothetical protein
VEADVEHPLRHAAVEEVAEAVGVPAEPRVGAAGHVEKAIDNDAVFLGVADARIGPDELEDRREAPVADERLDLV